MGKGHGQQGMGQYKKELCNYEVDDILEWEDGGPRDNSEIEKQLKVSEEELREHTYDERVD